MIGLDRTRLIGLLFYEELLVKTGGSSPFRSPSLRVQLPVIASTAKQSLNIKEKLNHEIASGENPRNDALPRSISHPNVIQALN